MGKLQDFSVIAYVFIFISLASKTHSTSQTYFLNRMYLSKQGIRSSSDTNNFNAFRRINEYSTSTTINDVNKKKLKNEDLIEKLPGQPHVSFRQYGGYVNVDKSAGRFLYYYFVETIKVHDSSPLVIWFNGGPGCSSLTGAFLEHGPFRIHSNNTLYSNPHSWNNEANILYVESPTTVGFSYTNSPSTEPNSQGDKITAEDNYMFLVKWLERFPEYKGREFYIASQSYGGHYGPQLAQLILHRNEHTFINLKGIVLGNPTFDDETQTKGGEEYLMSHALVSNEIMARKNQICNSITHPQIDDECWKATEDFENLTKHINLYSIYADVCLKSTSTNKHKEYITLMKFDPCSTNYMTTYLNMENVQEALHANTTKLSYPWKQCSDDVNLYWNQNERYASMLPVLHDLVGKGIRVLVYSGDQDYVVSVTSTMYALKKLNLTIEKIWRPWFSEGEVGGYTEEYKGNFTFATVRGAGHSVPSDQPIRALTLFTSFIRNIPLPNL